MRWLPGPLGLFVVALSALALRTPLGAVHVLLLLGAQLGWLLLAHHTTQARASRWAIGVAVVVGLLLRLDVAAFPPRHSDDVYRYVWDGRVLAHGINPYRFAPDDPQLASLRDETHARINHPHLPTIYPPLAEHLFGLLARLPGDPVRVVRVAVSLAELMTAMVLMLHLGRRALWWWCAPLVAWELWGDAHVDGLAILGLVVALWLEARNRPVWSGLALGLSAACKPFALPLAALDRRPWRALLAGLVLLLLYASLAEPEAPLLGSLFEYGRRWRSNAGLFAIVEGALRAGLDVLHVDRWELPLPVATALSGRARPTLFPDEIAGLVARAGLALVWLALLVRWRRRPDPAAAALRVLLLFVLASPTVHPWYALWLVPLAAALEDQDDRSAAWAARALVALIPLGYWPLAEYRATGVYDEPVWTRLIQHGVAWTVWLALSVRTFRARRSGIR